MQLWVLTQMQQHFMTGECDLEAAKGKYGPVFGPLREKLRGSGSRLSRKEDELYTIQHDITEYMKLHGEARGPGWHKIIERINGWNTKVHDCWSSGNKHLGHVASASAAANLERVPRRKNPPVPEYPESPIRK